MPKPLRNRDKTWPVIAARSTLSLFILIVGLALVFPLVFMISASFKNNADVFSTPLDIIPKNPTLANYDKILHDARFFSWYLNTLVVVTMTIALRVWIVSMAAYAFARLDFVFKNALFLVLVASIMVPPDTTIVSKFLMYKTIGLYDTLAVLIVPAVFDVFFVFMMRQFFVTIPFELTEAAKIDGCSHLTTFARIILPLAKPALITMGLFTFIWTWNDFLHPYILINDLARQTITVGLSFYQGRAGANYALQLAGASFGVVFPVILFLFAQKYFVEGIASSGIKG